MGDRKDETELLRYLESVRAECKKRRERVEGLNEEIAVLKKQMTELQTAQGPTIIARALKVATDFKSTLDDRHTLKETELRQAKEDLARAVERQKDIESEIEATRLEEKHDR